MRKEIMEHFLSFGMYTDPGLYSEKLKKDLPNDVREIGLLVRKNLIHRTTLVAGNTGTNADLKFGDMSEVPWHRQSEDDILITTGAMLTELYRRDPRGLVLDRKPANKLILTCRFTAVLMASILKVKGIPARVRAGNAPYFDMGSLGKVSADHWINQYWNQKEGRWVTIDVDGSLSLRDQFDPYDIPDGKFDFPADAWLNIENGKDSPDRFFNAKPEKGKIVVLWSLFYDFHSLMNQEVIYCHGNIFGNYGRFKQMNRIEKEKISNLAKLMQRPDENFSELKQLWENDRELRLLSGGLIG
jgi:hypothetical protein